MKCWICGAEDHVEIELANGWKMVGCPEVPRDRPIVFGDPTEAMARRIFEESVSDPQKNAVFPLDVGPTWKVPEKEKGPTPEGAEPQVCQLCKKPYVKCFCLPL